MSERRRDPRQARFVTLASLRWIVRHHAWTPWYLVRYWRFLKLRMTSPHIVTTGFVFIGKHVQIEARRGYGRIVLGKWVHLGDDNRLRCHEGSIVVGDRCVFGRDNTVNAYLDIEIGEAVLVADWVYICDFDHVTDDITVAIKDQGIVKSPVRIGAGSWLGTKSTVLRGTRIGVGSVVAAHAVARGVIPDYSIVAGVPGRVVKDRRLAYAEGEQRRKAIADIARKTRADVERQTSMTRASSPPNT